MLNLITLEVNGKNYTDLLSYDIEKDIENLCGTFSVDATSRDDAPNPIQPNDAIVLAIDGEPFITGFVDEQEIDYGTDSHTIKISGRDKTADFVDSRLDAKAFNPPIGFEELLKKLLVLVGYEVVSRNKKIGLTTTNNQIAIINNYGVIEKFSTAENIQLKHAESAFQLIRRCAEKRQLILNSDGDGNIVIAGIGDTEALTILQNIEGGSGNNLKNAKARFSWQERFHTYKIKSMTTQGSAGGVLFSNDTQTPDPLANNATPQIGTAIDPDVRPTRIYSAFGSSAMTSADCKRRAEWEANIRKTKGFSYSCEVVGFRQNLSEDIKKNPLWKPNQLVYVVDEFAGIEDELLIKSVSYKKELRGGSVTRLQLVDKLAYTTSIFEPLLRRKKNNTGNKEVLFAI